MILIKQVALNQADPTVDSIPKHYQLFHGTSCESLSQSENFYNQFTGKDLRVTIALNLISFRIFPPLWVKYESVSLSPLCVLEYTFARVGDFFFNLLLVVSLKKSNLNVFGKCK
ncbi:hypothetical protein KIL84_001088 [Mauremys mutica]|uniref:Uncharacterized protein n=1 Tax=Mauremys mutica TaxID=74926 RepID=A0A9D3X069_9SAUR|nr:hypothetical protein KIL84_001088 [Mauremys mutica]